MSERERSVQRGGAKGVSVCVRERERGVCKCVKEGLYRKSIV